MYLLSIHISQDYFLIKNVSASLYNHDSLMQSIENLWKNKTIIIHLGIIIYCIYLFIYLHKCDIFIVKCVTVVNHESS